MINFFKGIGKKKQESYRRLGDSSSYLYEQFKELLDNADKLSNPSNERKLEFYEIIPPVQTAIDKIADAFNDIDIFVAEKNSKEKQEKHQILADLKSPNKFQRQRNFFEELIKNYLLTGDAYVLIKRSSLSYGGIQDMQVIPSHLISFSNNTDLIDFEIEYILDTTRYKFRMERKVIGGNRVKYFTEINDKNKILINLKNANPKDFFKGVGRFDACALQMETYNLISKYNNAFVDNGARPTLAFVPKEQITKEQHTQLLDNIQKGVSGTNNAGKALVLSSPIEIENLASSVRDMDFRELQKSLENTIYFASGVPLSLVRQEGTNSNEYAKGIESFYNMCLNLTEKVLTFLTDELMPLYPKSENYKLSYSRSSISALQNSLVLIARAMTDTGVVKGNEVRSVMGLSEESQFEGVVASVQSKTAGNETKNPNKNTNENKTQAQNNNT